MKKSLLIIIMFASMVLAACGETEKENNGTTNNGVTNNNGTTNNGTTKKNNGTTAPNNGTTAGNNGTTTNNGTTAATTGTTNQACVESTVAGPCDALCQTGCADIQTCVAGVFTQGQPAEELCQPIGPGTQGVACGQAAACAEGFGCLGGFCAKYCRLPSGMPDCPAEEVCVSAIAQGANVGVCRGQCTMFPDNCVATEKCVAVSATETTCAPAGAKAKGETCAQGECGKTLGCIGPQGGATVCRTLCDTANATQCDAGANETCTMLGGGVPFGACIPPA